LLADFIFEAITMGDNTHSTSPDAVSFLQTNSKDESEKACAKLSNCAFERPVQFLQVADNKITFDPKAVAKAGDDLVKGVWSDETRKYFKQVFDRAAHEPKASIDSIGDTLKDLSIRINQLAEKQGSRNEIALAAIPLLTDLRVTRFWMLVTGPGITNEQTVEGVGSGKGGPKAANVGDFVPNKNLPKPHGPQLPIYK